MVKMAKLFALPILALALGLFMAMAVSAEEVTDVNVSEPVVEINDSLTESELQDIEEAFPESIGNPGITPDSPVLYGLDRAMERISLALTFGKSAKAQKGLEHARERLLEVKAMILQKKIAQAEKASEKYEERMDEVKEAMEGLEEDGSEDRIVGAARNLINLQNRIENQEMAVEALKEILSEQNLTESQRTRLENMVGKMENKTQAVRERAEKRQENVRERLRAVTQKNESEIEDIFGDLTREEGLDQARQKKAERLIVRTEESLAKLRAKLNIAREEAEEEEEIESEVESPEESNEQEAEEENETEVEEEDESEEVPEVEEGNETESEVESNESEVEMPEENEAELEGNETGVEEAPEVEAPAVVLDETQVSAVEGYIQEIEARLAEARTDYAAGNYEEVIEILKPVGNFGRQVSVAVRLRNLERLERLKEQKAKTIEKLEKAKEKLEQKREKILSKVRFQAPKSEEVEGEEGNESEENEITGKSPIKLNQGRKTR